MNGVLALSLCRSGWRSDGCNRSGCGVMGVDDGCNRSGCGVM